VLLQNKLSTIRVGKIDTVMSYLAKITKLKNWLAAKGTMVEDKELVCIALDGLVSSWRCFV
jgi:hypothetical protein